MKRSCLKFIILLGLIAFTILIFAYLSGVPLSITGYAEKLYGPPNESLEPGERIVLSTLIIINRKDLISPSAILIEDTTFHIELGESINAISDRLYEKNLILNPKTFRDYLVYTGIDTQIQAGEHILNSKMTAIDIANNLRNSSTRKINFGILAGWRAEEIAATLPRSGLNIAQDEFNKFILLNNAEGYLLPGLYTFDRSISTEFMVQTLMGAFEAAISPELESGFMQSGFSLHDAVILASIVEREAVVEEEMPLIASVFINRLNINMKLDADPTVQYAIGYNQSQGNWWTNPLSLTDLEIYSPFNTYLYNGLPPAPICNPGLDALRAVAFPAQTPYYYFRAGCDQTGRHLFAETFKEHKDNACP